MKTYILEREQKLPISRSEVFDFFGDAFNLERITPGFLNFRILSARPIKMAAGTLIEYRLSLYGIPFKWRTRIESWTPDESFVDLQIKGPYALWRHTHTFEELGPKLTLMRDVVQYRIPFGLLGRFAHWLFVRRMLESIFDYRAEATAKLLGSIDRSDRGIKLKFSETAMGD